MPSGTAVRETRRLPNGAAWGKPWLATRCVAHSKRSGLPCRQPAMTGKRVCRLHGGKSPGAPRGKAHGRYIHGMRTIEVKAQFAWLNLAVKRFRLLKRYTDDIRLGRTPMPFPPRVGPILRDGKVAAPGARAQACATPMRAKLRPATPSRLSWAPPPGRG